MSKAVCWDAGSGRHPERPPGPRPSFIRLQLLMARSERWRELLVLDTYECLLFINIVAEV